MNPALVRLVSLTTLACGSVEKEFEEAKVPAVVLALSTVGEGELQKSLRMHLVEEFELGGQLMGLLPLGGELGALLVVVVVRQLLTRVGVPPEGPEAVQVDLVAHG